MDTNQIERYLIKIIPNIVAKVIAEEAAQWITVHPGGKGRKASGSNHITARAGDRHAKGPDASGNSQQTGHPSHPALPGRKVSAGILEGAKPSHPAVSGQKAGRNKYGRPSGAFRLLSSYKADGNNNNSGMKCRSLLERHSLDSSRVWLLGYACDAEFREEDHKRDETGKFTSGCGNSISNPTKKKNNSDWNSDFNQAKRMNMIEDAMNEISSGKSEATIKKLRNDLEQYGGTNDVTIVRGDRNKGLIHIEKRHGYIITKVLEAVANGKIARFVNAKKTIIIQKDGFEAVLSLVENNKKKT